MSPIIHDIELGVGAGPIKLGLDQDDIQKAYSYIYRSFFKSPNSKNRSEHCELAGFIVHYDFSKKVECIELFNEENQEVQYRLFGIEMSKLTIKALKNSLIKKNVMYSTNVYGLEAESIGLATYNNNLESEQDIVECICLSTCANA